MPPMNAVPHPVTVLLALPLAYQDGRDKYAGFLRYVSERRMPWNVRLERDRLSPAYARQILREGIDAAVLDGTAEAAAVGALVAVPVCVALDASDTGLFRQRRVAFANIDSAALGRHAADHFLSRPGTPCLAFVGYAPGVRWSQRRQEAFRKRLAAAGRTPHELTLPCSGAQTSAVRRALGKFLRGLPRPACVFAACDRLARRIAEVSAEEGFAVPNEISILGVDNEEIICTHARPTLSSLQPDFTALGYEAARLLDRMLATRRRPPAERHVGGVRLVARESTAPSYSAAFLVAQVKDTILHWPDGIPRVGDIANALGVSRRLVDLRFREITGESVLGFIHREQMEKVKKLLAETDMPIGDICKSCAFRSVNQVKRIFRAVVGMPMRDWRKAHK